MDAPQPASGGYAARFYRSSLIHAPHSALLEAILYSQANGDGGTSVGSPMRGVMGRCRSRSVGYMAARRGLPVLLALARGRHARRSTVPVAQSTGAAPHRYTQLRLSWRWNSVLTCNRGVMVAKYSYKKKQEEDQEGGIHRLFTVCLSMNDSVLGNHHCSFCFLVSSCGQAAACL